MLLGVVGGFASEDDDRRENVLRTPVDLARSECRGFDRSLQLWLKTDSLSYQDQQPVYVWPDQTGKGHDLTITADTRPDGVGTPPLFVEVSHINS